MFIWTGKLENVLKREGKESGKVFLIAVVDGLEIPFFGYSKDSLESLEIGDMVKVVIHEGERNGFPSISGFYICKELI